MSRRKAVAFAVAAALLLEGGTARAHVIVQRPGLRQLLQSSEATVVAEIRSPLRTWEAPGGADRQDYFSVRVLETIVGEPPPERFDVFPHGEGLPAWQPGDVALLFLERTAHRPELAGLAARFPYFTIQQSGQEWKLADGDAGAVRAAAIGYRELSGRTAGEAAPALRKLVLQNLRSGVDSLREDGFAELARATSVPGFFATPSDLAPFMALVARRPVLPVDGRPALPVDGKPVLPVDGKSVLPVDGKSVLPVTTRVAIARVLDGLHGFAADPAILAITQEPLSDPERVQLVRVAGTAQNAAISAWLGGQLVSPDATLRREAAYALGHPWHAPQAGALAQRLADPDPTVARAALRSLAALGSPEAMAMLQRVAAGDAGFLKLIAEAELRRIALEKSPSGTLGAGSDTSASSRPLP